MKFRKGIRKEIQQMLTAQLNEYEQTMQMTKAEKHELHAWVAEGHSPYDNGDCIYGENGCPMDFINASRFVDEAVEWFSSLTEAEQEKKLQKVQYGYDTQLDTPFAYDGSFAAADDANEEIPF